MSQVVPESSPVPRDVFLSTRTPISAQARSSWRSALAIPLRFQGIPPTNFQRAQDAIHDGKTTKSVIKSTHRWVEVGEVESPVTFSHAHPPVSTPACLEKTLIRRVHRREDEQGNQTEADEREDGTVIPGLPEKARRKEHPELTAELEHRDIGPWFPLISFLVAKRGLRWYLGRTRASARPVKRFTSFPDGVHRTAS